MFKLHKSTYCFNYYYKHFLDTLILSISFYIIEINNLPDDLMNVSAIIKRWFAVSGADAALRAVCEKDKARSTAVILCSKSHNIKCFSGTLIL